MKLELQVVRSTRPAGVLAAAATGARLVYGDNLNAYGPVAGPLTEDLPPATTGPNGRLRAELAAAVLAAHRAVSSPEGPRHSRRNLQRVDDEVGYAEVRARGLHG